MAASNTVVKPEPLDEMEIIRAQVTAEIEEHPCDKLPPMDEKEELDLEELEDDDFVDEDLFDTTVDAPVPEQEPNLLEAQLILHSRVYTLAEKYNIRGLKQLATKKFSAQVSAHWRSSEYALAMQDVYDSTVDSDRGLRDVVIQSFRAHPELVQSKDVEAIVKETPNLAWELFRVGWGLPVV